MHGTQRVADPLRVLLVLAFAVLLLAQVVVLPLDLPARKLHTLVQHDRIFSEGSLAWVDAIVWAIAVAWALLLGVFYFAVSWKLPGLPAALLLMLVAGAVLGLLIVVMRALLRQATTQRADMDAVISCLSWCGSTSNWPSAS